MSAEAIKSKTYSASAEIPETEKEILPVLELSENEKPIIREKKKIPWVKRIVNIPNFLFILIWAASFLPSRYDTEMRQGLHDFKAFGVVLIIIEIIYMIRNGIEKEHQSQKDIIGFLYGFFLLWGASEKKSVKNQLTVIK